jgi:hypothetical protein
MPTLVTPEALIAAYEDDLRRTDLKPGQVGSRLDAIRRLQDERAATDWQKIEEAQRIAGVLGINPPPGIQYDVVIAALAADQPVDPELLARHGTS